MAEIRSLTSIVKVQFPLICCLLGSIDSTAATLFSETFSYSDGDLTTVSGGNWENSQPAVLAGLNPVQVVSGEAQIVNRVDVSEGVFHSFESQTTGTLYLGFDFNLDRLSDPRDENATLFFHKSSIGGDRSGGDFWISEPEAGGDFTVGISSRDSTPDALWATDLTFDTWYRAVIAYDLEEDIATLWIDPIIEGSTSINGAKVSSVANLDRVLIRQRLASVVQEETLRLDNMVVSTTFAEATAVPEPSLFIPAGSLGLLFWLWLRRRHSALTFQRNDASQAHCRLDQLLCWVAIPLGLIQATV